MTVLARRVGRRGAALLFFAVLDLVYCYALLRPPPGQLPEAYRWPQTVMPLWAWAACWGAVGVLCLVSVFLARDTAAFTAAVGLYAAWGLLAMWGQVMGVAQRGYVSAVIFLAFAAFVHLIAGGIPTAPARREGRAWIRS
jgi:hypothetical protein